MGVEKRLDLSPERVIALAGVVQEGSTVGGIERERCLKEFIYLLPSLGFHNDRDKATRDKLQVVAAHYLLSYPSTCQLSLSLSSLVTGHRLTDFAVQPRFAMLHSR